MKDPKKALEDIAKTIGADGVKNLGASVPSEPVVMWLVQRNIDYEGSWVIGVYSTLEKAKKSKEQQDETLSHISITEIKLDEDIDT